MLDASATSGVGALGEKQLEARCCVTIVQQSQPTAPEVRVQGLLH